jgi:hypothetical protein
MRYSILATDYDGTIAHNGIVAESTVAVLRKAQEAGLRLILVTGRELPDVLHIFAHCDLFDRIVAENGALLHDPRTGISQVLAPPPPPLLLDALSRKRVPVSVGRSVIATVVPHEHAMLEAIHQLGLEWHIIFNKESVMALPSSVTKASGLTTALKELGVSASQVAGVGDAENDQAFLQICGLSAAVANAVPALKAIADVVTSGADGAGVTELIGRILSRDFG